MKTLPFISIVIFLAATSVSKSGDQQQIDAMMKHGIEAQKNKDYTQAIKDFSAIIKLSPDLPAAYFLRGSTYMTSGDTNNFDHALVDLNEAIRLNPNVYIAYEQRGNVYSVKGQFDEAISDYDMAIKIGPGDKEVFKSRGIVYYWKSNFGKAIIDFTDALKFSTNDPVIYYYRGKAYLHKNERRNALSDFDTVIRLTPYDTTSLLLRAGIYSEMSLFTNAIQDLEAVIKLKPNSVDPNNSLAWLLASCPSDQLRDGKRAVKLAMKACDLTKWSNFACLDSLAAAYAETGDFESALKYQKQAASMNAIPEDIRASMQNRVDLYLQHRPYREPNGTHN